MTGTAVGLVEAMENATVGGLETGAGVEDTAAAEPLIVTTTGFEEEDAADAAADAAWRTFRSLATMLA